MYTIYGKPDCPYCERAKELLKSKWLDFEYFDVVKDSGKFAEMIGKVVDRIGTRPRTVPQIFSPEGEYIGGYDDLHSTFVSKAVINDLEDFDEFSL